MKIVYFDTETTGLSPSINYMTGFYGQICQLSYVIVDGGELRAKNFFFKVQHMDMSSIQITGLTVEKLDILSNGKKFIDSAKEIFADFAEADCIVSHNFNFDKKFMEAEFERVGLKFTYKKAICSMRSTVDYLKIPGKRTAYKVPSLAELASFFGVYDFEVIQKTKELFGSDSVAHDARFDTVKLMLAVEIAKLECPALAELN